MHSAVYDCRLRYCCAHDVAATQGMSSSFDSLEATVAGQCRQLGDLATALKSLQGAQASASAWQATASAHMTETDKVIAELKGAMRKESPRHAQARMGQQDVSMADASATPVPGTPSSGPSAPLHGQTTSSGTAASNAHPTPPTANSPPAHRLRPHAAAAATRM